MPRPQVVQLALCVIRMASDSYSLTTSADKATGEKEDEEKKHHALQKGFICEVVLLGVTIAIVLGLMLLPIIFYHLPVNIQTVSTHGSSLDGEGRSVQLQTRSEPASMSTLLLVDCTTHDAIS